MRIIKFYDTSYDMCHNGYGAQHVPPHVTNRNLAEAEMRQNGWGERGGLTLCRACLETQPLINTTTKEENNHG